MLWGVGLNPKPPKKNQQEVILKIDEIYISSIIALQIK